MRFSCNRRKVFSSLVISVVIYIFLMLGFMFFDNLSASESGLEIGAHSGMYLFTIPGLFLFVLLVIIVFVVLSLFQKS